MDTKKAAAVGSDNCGSCTTVVKDMKRWLGLFSKLFVCLKFLNFDATMCARE